MYIEIKRIRQYGEIIEGQLFIDAFSDHGKHMQYICDTLENGLTPLPLGKYQIQVQKCHFRSRKMPLVITDPDNPAPHCKHCVKPEHVNSNSSPHKGGAKGEALFCPMITMGNGIHNRHDGSILVGQQGARGLLLHPKTTFDLLYERIRKSASRGNTTTLNITE